MLLHFRRVNRGHMQIMYMKKFANNLFYSQRDGGSFMILSRKSFIGHFFFYCLLRRYLTDLTNCIQDKYNRGSDFCGSRAASHYGRIFDLTLQGVGCSAGGFSTFNSFGGSNSGFNNNNNFNNFNNNNNNNGFNNRYPNNNNGFDSRYPNNNNNNNNGFGNSGNNWNNQNSGWPNSGNNWNSGSSWNSGSNSNWPQNSGSNSNWPNSNSGSSWPNSHGSSSSSFSSSSWDGFGSGNNPPPYSYRRPNSGSGLQSTMAIIFTLALTACLAL